MAGYISFSEYCKNLAIECGAKMTANNEAVFDTDEQTREFERRLEEARVSYSIKIDVSDGRPLTVLTHGSGIMKKI